MATELGPLQATVFLDLAKSWNPNVGRLKSDMKTADVRGKELSTTFGRMGGGLKMIAGAVATLGLVELMRRSLAFSPQWTAMWARLTPSFMKLGRYIGGQLSPLFKKLETGAKHFIDKVIELDREYGVLKTLGELAGKALDMAVTLDDKTGGALTFLMIAGAVTIPLLTTLALGKTFVSWLAGTLGLSVGATGLAIVGGGIIIGATIAFVAKKTIEGIETIKEQLGIISEIETRHPGITGEVIGRRIRESPIGRAAGIAETYGATFYGVPGLGLTSYGSIIIKTGRLILGGDGQTTSSPI